MNYFGSFYSVDLSKNNNLISIDMLIFYYHLIGTTVPGILGNGINQQQPVIKTKNTYLEDFPCKYMRHA